MASNIYYRTIADGKTTIHSRKGTQGRKLSPPELVKVPMTIYVLPTTKAKIEATAKNYGWSVSECGETALVMFDYGILRSGELL